MEKAKKERKQKICGYFDNPYLRENFEKLTGEYGIHTRIAEDTETFFAEQADFLMTDRPELFTERVLQERGLLEEDAHRPVLCVLQNPMLQNLAGTTVTVVNKPLYSLNLCSLLNHGKMYSGTKEQELLFEAPEAHILLVDDTPLQKRGKEMELVSKYFNHVTMGYEYGYRVLTLAWTDGVTTIPVRYSLLASSYDEKVRGKIRTDLDGRSLGARIRKLARTSMNDLTVKFACDAVKAGIPASIICFDSWFAVPHTISRLMKEANLTVIARLKTNSKQYYEYEGKMMNIKTLYKIHRKRRGKAMWKLSLSVNLLVKDKNKVSERIPVKIVYLPNRANNKEWICLLSTDTTLSEEEIIRQYGKRWNIEVMFKTCKQYLKFGKDFQSPAFECQNAQIALAFARYMFLAVEQRESEDKRSFGELFLLAYQEMQDISYGVALMLIVSLFKDGMKNVLGISEEQIQAVVDYVMGNMPEYLLRTLSAVNNVPLAS